MPTKAKGIQLYYYHNPTLAFIGAADGPPKIYWRLGYDPLRAITIYAIWWFWPIAWSYNQSCRLWFGTGQWFLSRKMLDITPGESVIFWPARFKWFYRRKK